MNGGLGDDMEVSFMPSEIGEGSGKVPSGFSVSILQHNSDHFEESWRC